MKRIISLILALLIFSLPAFAQTSDKVDLISLDGVTVYEVGDEVLGMDKDAFKEYVKENNIVFYGIANDNSYVIEATCKETSFSSSVKDFKNIKLSDIKDFADSTKILNYNIERLGDAVYIIREVTSDDLAESSKVTQFITVKQGFVYVISVINKEGAEKAKSVVSSIVYNFTETPAQISVWHIVIVSAAIVLVLLVFIFVGIALIKDLKKRNVKNEETAEEE